MMPIVLKMALPMTAGAFSLCFFATLRNNAYQKMNAANDETPGLSVQPAEASSREHYGGGLGL
jgi:hypothetical protein